MSVQLWGSGYASNEKKQSNVVMDSFCQKKRLASNETLSAVWITFRGETFTARWKMYTTVVDESCTHRLSSKTSK